MTKYFEESRVATKTPEILMMHQTLSESQDQDSLMEDMLFISDIIFPKQKNLSVSEKKTLIHVALRNCFSLSDHNGDEIGSGLFVNTSLFNHSCFPNAFVINDGNKIKVMAVNKIVPQDEICISYLLGIEPRIIRQLRLEKLWKFKCSCQRCQDEIIKEKEEKIEIDMKKAEEIENLILSLEKSNITLGFQDLLSYISKNTYFSLILLFTLYSVYKKFKSQETILIEQKLLDSLNESKIPMYWPHIALLRRDLVKNSICQNINRESYENMLKNLYICYNNHPIYQEALNFINFIRK